MDHSLGTRGFPDTSALSGQDSFNEFVAWNDRTPSSPLHGADVRALWTDLRERAAYSELPDPQDPQTALSEFQLTTLAFVALLEPRWTELAQTLQGLAAAPPLPPGASPSPRQPEFVADAFRGIFCADWRLPVRDYPEYAAHLRRLAKLAPDMRYGPFALVGLAACLGTPAPVRNPQHRLRIRTDAPLLLLNARHDPVTGYAWATAVADQLGDRAVLLTYAGWGHGAYLRGDCTQGAVDRYLLALVLPPNGTTCPPVTPE